MTEKEQVDKEERTDSQSSIKISRNAKGDYAYETKIYADDPIEADVKIERYMVIAEGAIAKAIAREGRA